MYQEQTATANNQNSEGFFNLYDQQDFEQVEQPTTSTDNLTDFSAIDLSKQPNENATEGFSAHTVQHQTEELLRVSKKQNSKIHNEFKEFLELDPKECELEDLERGRHLFRTFSQTQAVIHQSAVGIGTYWKIQEGRLMDKILAINDEVGDLGREEFAAKAFPYKKSTRCSYIQIGKIAGGESYSFLGINFMRKVTPAIEKMKIQGPDQIKALLEKFDEECDLSIGHNKFKEKLQSILKQVLNSADDEEAAPSTPTEADENDEEVAPSTLTEADENDEEAAPSTPNEPDAGGTNGSGNNIKTGKTAGGKTKILDEDSVHRVLAILNSSIRDLLKLDPPKEAFDMLLFDEAKELIEQLELYVKGESTN